MDRLREGIPLLLSWFSANKRDLPWRHERTFYTVLVSELMLQQTRVETVKERFVRFLARFPDEQALASASEDEVLKEWEGLGYYSRACHLHAAAKILAEKGTPKTVEDIRALPGVGEYTAGALSSVALNLPVPAVDGNVVRVLSRLLADGSDIDSAKKKFTRILSEVYPPETADFTEALMELGAIVCLPNGEPLCSRCPWETLCLAHQQGEEEAFPARRQKKERRVEERNVFVLRRGGKYALRRRGEGLLSGMWEFPNTLAPEQPFEGKTLATKKAKHVFTHVEWRMTGFLLDMEESSCPAEEGTPLLWATAEEIFTRYAIPSAFKPFTDWLK